MLRTLIVIDGDNIYFSLAGKGKRINPGILLAVLAEKGAANVVGAHFFRSGGGTKDFEAAGFTGHQGPLGPVKKSIPDSAIERVIHDAAPDFDRLVLVSCDGDFNGLCRRIVRSGKDVWRVVYGSHSKKARKCCHRLIRLEELARTAPGLIYKKGEEVNST